MQQNHLDIANQLLNVSLKITNQSKENIDERTSSYIRIAEAYQQLAQVQQAAAVIQTALELNRQSENNPYLFWSLDELAEYFLKNNNQPEAIKLLHQAFSITKQVDDYEERDNMLVRLGAKFGIAEAYNHALDCAELIEDDYDQVLLYIQLVWNYIDQQNHVQALIIIEKAEGSGWNDYFLEETVESYLEQEDFARAFETIEKITQEQTKVTALSDIAHKYWEIGNESAAVKSLAKAQEIADRIPNSYTKSCSLQAISRVAQQIGNTQESESLLSASVNEAQQINQPLFQGFAFNNLAFQLVSASKYDEAIKMIETSNPFIPKFQKVRILIEIANQCQKSNQPAEAEQMIDIAMETVKEITGNDLRIPDEDARSFAWNDIADYALQHEQYELALMILQRIESSIGKLRLLVTISNTYINHGEQQKARETLQKAVEQHTNIKESENLYLAEDIALQYAQIKDYDSAIKVVKLIPLDLGQSNALVNIALKYAESPEPLESNTLEMIETWG